MTEQKIEIGEIVLIWSEWIPFEIIKKDSRKSPLRLPKKPGVYEVVIPENDIRLTIGKAGNISDRLKCLVRGGVSHSAGKKIKIAFPDVSTREKFLVRYALTERPAASEEELHKLHVQSFGRLPMYTDR